MKRYSVAYAMADEIGKAVARLETNVNERINDGYDLAGNLLHAASFEDGEWHVLLQPMMYEREDETS